MTSTPDISSLSLSHKPNLEDDDQYFEDDGRNPARSQYHYATSPPIPAQSQYNPLSINQTPSKKPLRAGLPTQWMDAPSTGDTRSMSPNPQAELPSHQTSPPIGMHAPVSSRTPGPGDDDDVIPTAIVIKNIPFNVRRETLLDIIASLNIPTPYAFNYHLDQQGSFRGLAFANFREAEDADAVVVALNGFDVQGRKLRVEYKKVLQAGEKERIEREKAIRRMRSMQMERPEPNGYDEYGTQVHNPYANERAFSNNAYSMSPVQQAQQPHYSPPNPNSLIPQSLYQQPNRSPPLPIGVDKNLANELDLNDPSTLEIYSRILLFKDDRMRDELAFSRNLTPKQRRVVHLVAQKLGVYHHSVGEGEERYAVVTRSDPTWSQQQQQPQVTNASQTSRQLSQGSSLSRAPSSYLPSTSNSQTAAVHAALRVKKSMPDLKTLQSQPQRLSTRSSNGNIREGFNTIASPQRRTTTPSFNSIFGTNGSSIPPVPSIPGMNNGSSGLESSSSTSGVVRQPRGPGESSGFNARRDRVAASESSARPGLEARSHEPLEI